MKRFFIILSLLTLTCLKVIGQDGNTFDTLKASINETYTFQLYKSDSIDDKLNKADKYLKYFVARLVDAKDSSYYLKKKQELKEIKELEHKQPTKALTTKKENVLLQLSILNPEKSFPYYDEWLQIMFTPDILSKRISQSTNDFCFYRAYLYTLLIKQFPNERAYVKSLAITYYNQAVEIIQSLNYDDKDMDKKVAIAARFSLKAKAYYEKSKEMKK